jgi:RNA polymerase subunit RPABC4/transcription elongation factor Spt4
VGSSLGTLYKDCSHCTRPNNTQFKQCELCRTARRRRNWKYATTEKGHAAHRAKHRRCNKTEKGRMRRRRYENNKRMERVMQNPFSRKSIAENLRMLTGNSFRIL